MQLPRRFNQFGCIYDVELKKGSLSSVIYVRTRGADVTFISVDDELNLKESITVKKGEIIGSRPSSKQFFKKYKKKKK